MFVVDEVGQFVARDVQKMLDLQAVVQQLRVMGRGKYWIVVTSQEKLNELVSGLDDRNIELARLMDRFPLPLQVHLEPSDISEVTSRRVLAKNSGAEQTLGALFEANRGRLVRSTRVQSDIRLPGIDRQSFVDLYPLLPYQIDLIIQIVSGLRTQSGASRHVGGANRTIIKLAQQLLINPQTRLASQDVGVLVRLDHVYDLVEGNISSDIRAKIASIPSKVDHPKAQAVAKTVCLLQFVKSVRRSTENVAACLHDARRPPTEPLISASSAGKFAATSTAASVTGDSKQAASVGAEGGNADRFSVICLLPQAAANGCRPGQWAAFGIAPASDGTGQSRPYCAPLPSVGSRPAVRHASEIKSSSCTR